MPTIIQQLFQQLRADIAQPRADLLADGRNILIYGAGNVGKEVYSLLTERGANVRGFIDRSAAPGAQWQGLPIIRPEDCALDAAERRRTHVVIGIFNAFVELPPIERMLQELGFGKITTFLELHDAFASELGDRFWLTRRSYYAGAEAACQAVYNQWSDAESRDLFASILRFRFTKDPTALPAPELPHQYFHPGLPQWPSPLRFVDCGAYNGDTLESLRKSGLEVAAIAAFEPDLANFSKLSHYVESNRESLPKSVCLFPCGVDSSTRQLRFASTQGAGSHFDPTGDTLVQCVSIDDALHGFSPNLIKMDIEGAELSALWGARRTIEECHPGLAICLYHCPPHLWQIPLLLQAWYGDSARYFLRGHCYNGFDWVLYVIPN